MTGHIKAKCGGIRHAACLRKHTLLVVLPPQVCDLGLAHQGGRSDSPGPTSALRPSRAPFGILATLRCPAYPTLPSGPSGPSLPALPASSVVAGRRVREP